MNDAIKLLKQASEMEKKACVDFVTGFTQAGIVSLVKGGVQFEKAAQMMKEACENDPSLRTRQLNSVAFEKAAEYIEQLESQVEELNKFAEEAVVTVQALDEGNPLNKLAGAGFSAEEIQMISHLPENLIEKVASNNSKPWEMGGAVGFSREKTDPLLEFILG